MTEGMKIEVEISQNLRVGENQWVPALIHLIIAVPTGDKGPNAHITPTAEMYIDLTPERAMELAEELTRHVKMIAEAEPHSL